ncbi:Chromosome-associated kinesin kif4a, partial [Quaeritorhiza haematococci]
SFYQLRGEVVVDLLGQQAEPPQQGQQGQGENALTLTRGAGARGKMRPKEMLVRNAEEVVRCLNTGLTRASILPTSTHPTQSVFTIFLHTQRTTTSTSTLTSTTSAFKFVDLSPSSSLRQLQRASSLSPAQQAAHAMEQSALVAFNKVVNALADKGEKGAVGGVMGVPYMESKLTRVLQEALGGNCHTLMIACAIPTLYTANDTMHTLRVSSRAQQIINRPRINNVYPDTINPNPTSGLTGSLTGTPTAPRGIVDELREMIGVAAPVSPKPSTDASFIAPPRRASMRDTDNSLQIELDRKSRMCAELQARITYLQEELNKASKRHEEQLKRLEEQQEREREMAALLQSEVVAGELKKQLEGARRDVEGLQKEFGDSADLGGDEGEVVTRLAGAEDAANRLAAEVERLAVEMNGLVMERERMMVDLHYLQSYQYDLAVASAAVAAAGDGVGTPANETDDKDEEIEHLKQQLLERDHALETVPQLYEEKITKLVGQLELLAEATESGLAAAAVAASFNTPTATTIDVAGGDSSSSDSRSSLTSAYTTASDDSNLSYRPPTLPSLNERSDSGFGGDLFPDLKDFAHRLEMLSAAIETSEAEKDAMTALIEEREWMLGQVTADYHLVLSYLGEEREAKAKKGRDLKELGFRGNDGQTPVVTVVDEDTEMMKRKYEAQLEDMREQLAHRESQIQVFAQRLGMFADVIDPEITPTTKASMLPTPPGTEDPAIVKSVESFVKQMNELAESIEVSEAEKDEVLAMLERRERELAQMTADHHLLMSYRCSCGGIKEPVVQHSHSDEVVTRLESKIRDYERQFTEMQQTIAKQEDELKKSHEEHGEQMMKLMGRLELLADAVEGNVALPPVAPAPMDEGRQVVKEPSSGMLNALAEFVGKLDLLDEMVVEEAPVARSVEATREVVAAPRQDSEPHLQRLVTYLSLIADAVENGTTPPPPPTSSEGTISASEQQIMHSVAEFAEQFNTLASMLEASEDEKQVLTERYEAHIAKLVSELQAVADIAEGKSASTSGSGEASMPFLREFAERLEVLGGVIEESEREKEEGAKVLRELALRIESATSAIVEGQAGMRGVEAGVEEVSALEYLVERIEGIATVLDGVDAFSGAAETSVAPMHWDADEDDVASLRKLLRERESQLAQITADHHLLLSYQPPKEVESLQQLLQERETQLAQLTADHHLMLSYQPPKEVQSLQQMLQERESQLAQTVADYHLVLSYQPPKEMQSLQQLLQERETQLAQLMADHHLLLSYQPPKEMQNLQELLQERETQLAQSTADHHLLLSYQPPKQVESLQRMLQERECQLAQTVADYHLSLSYQPPKEMQSLQELLQERESQLGQVTADYHLSLSYQHQPVEGQSPAFTNGAVDVVRSPQSADTNEQTMQPNFSTRNIVARNGTGVALDVGLYHLGNASNTGGAISPPINPITPTSSSASLSRTVMLSMAPTSRRRPSVASLATLKDTEEKDNVPVATTPLQPSFSMNLNDNAAGIQLLSDEITILRRRLEERDVEMRTVVERYEAYIDEMARYIVSDDMVELEVMKRQFRTGIGKGLAAIREEDGGVVREENGNNNSTSSPVYQSQYVAYTRRGSVEEDDSDAPFPTINTRMSLSDEVEMLRQQLKEREAEMDAAVVRYESYIDELARQLGQAGAVAAALANAAVAQRAAAASAPASPVRAEPEVRVVSREAEATVTKAVDSESESDLAEMLALRERQLAQTTADYHLLMSQQDQTASIQQHTTNESVASISRDIVTDSASSKPQLRLVLNTAANVADGAPLLEEEEEGEEQMIPSSRLREREADIEAATTRYEAHIDDLTRELEHAKVGYKGAVEAWKISLEEVKVQRNRADQLERRLTEVAQEQPRSQGVTPVRSMDVSTPEHSDPAQIRLDQMTAEYHLALSYLNDKAAETQSLRLQLEQATVDQHLALSYLNDRAAETEELQSRVNNLTAQHHLALSYLNDSAAESRELQSHVNNLTAQHHLALSYLNDSAAESQELQSHVNNITAQHHLALSYLNDKADEAQELQSRVNNITAQHHLALSYINDTTAESGDLQAQLNQRTADYFLVMSYLNDQAAEVEELKAQLSQFTLDHHLLMSYQGQTAVEAKSEQDRLLSQVNQLTADFHLLQSYQGGAQVQGEAPKRLLKNWREAVLTAQEMRARKNELEAQLNQMVVDQHLMMSYGESGPASARIVVFNAAAHHPAAIATSTTTVGLSKATDVHPASLQRGDALQTTRSVKEVSTVVKTNVAPQGQDEEHKKLLENWREAVLSAQEMRARKTELEAQFNQSVVDQHLSMSFGESAPTSARIVVFNAAAHHPAAIATTTVTVGFAKATDVHPAAMQSSGAQQMTKSVKEVSGVASKKMLESWREAVLSAQEMRVRNVELEAKLNQMVVDQHLIMSYSGSASVLETKREVFNAAIQHPAALATSTAVTGFAKPTDMHPAAMKSGSKKSITRAFESPRFHPAAVESKTLVFGIAKATDVHPAALKNAFESARFHPAAFHSTTDTCSILKATDVHPAARKSSTAGRSEAISVSGPVNVAMLHPASISSRSVSDWGIVRPEAVHPASLRSEVVESKERGVLALPRLVISQPDESIKPLISANPQKVEMLMQRLAQTTEEYHLALSYLGDHAASSWEHEKELEEQLNQLTADYHLMLSYQNDQDKEERYRRAVDMWKASATDAAEQRARAEMLETRLNQIVAEYHLMMSYNMSQKMSPRSPLRSPLSISPPSRAGALSPVVPTTPRSPVSPTEVAMLRNQVAQLTEEYHLMMSYQGENAQEWVEQLEALEAKLNQVTAEYHLLMSYQQQNAQAEDVDMAALQHQLDQVTEEYHLLMSYEGDRAVANNDLVESLQQQLNQVTADYHLLLSYQNDQDGDAQKKRLVESWKASAHDAAEQKERAEMFEKKYNQLLADHHLVLSYSSQAPSVAHENPTPELPLSRAVDASVKSSSRSITFVENTASMVEQVDDLERKLNQMTADFHLLISYQNAQDGDKRVVRLTDAWKSSALDATEQRQRADKLEAKLNQLIADHSLVLSYQEEDARKVIDLEKKLQQATIDHHLAMSYQGSQAAEYEEELIRLQSTANQLACDYHLLISFQEEHPSEMKKLQAKYTLEARRTMLKDLEDLRKQVREVKAKEASSIRSMYNRLSDLALQRDQAEREAILLRKMMKRMESQLNQLTVEYHYVLSYQHEYNEIKHQLSRDTCPSLLARIDDLTARYNQSVVENQYLQSFQHELAVLRQVQQIGLPSDLNLDVEVLDSPPASPTSQVSAYLESEILSRRASIVNTTEYQELKKRAMRTAEVEKQMKEMEARLRARDQYLHDTIMDTAHRIAELEHQVMELENLNEDLNRELKYAREDKELLVQELAVMDDDNLMLQNQLTHVEMAPRALVSTPDQLQEEFVLLRDIQTQTDDAEIHADTARAATTTTKTTSGVQSVEASTQTIDPSTPEQQILSISSRLTMATMLAETQEETIKELETQVSEARANCEKFMQQNWELKVKIEHVESVGNQRNKVIDELLRRVERLESERTARFLKQTVLSLTANRTSNTTSATGSPPTEFTIQDMLRDLDEIPQHVDDGEGSSYFSDELIQSVREIRLRPPRTATHSFYSLAPTEQSHDTVLDDDLPPPPVGPLPPLPAIPAQYRPASPPAKHPGHLSRSSFSPPADHFGSPEAKAASLERRRTANVEPRHRSLPRPSKLGYSQRMQPPPRSQSMYIDHGAVVTSHHFVDNYPNPPAGPRHSAVMYTNYNGVYHPNGRRPSVQDSLYGGRQSPPYGYRRHRNNSTATADFEDMSDGSESTLNGTEFEPYPHQHPVIPVHHMGGHYRSQRSSSNPNYAGRFEMSALEEPQMLRLATRKSNVYM